MPKKASKRSKIVDDSSKIVDDSSKILTTRHLTNVFALHSCGDSNCSFRSKPSVDFTINIQVDYNEAIDFVEWLNRINKLTNEFLFVLNIRTMPIVIKGALTNAKQLE